MKYIKNYEEYLKFKIFDSSFGYPEVDTSLCDVEDGEERVLFGILERENPVQ